MSNRHGATIRSSPLPPEPRPLPIRWRPFGGCPFGPHSLHFISNGSLLSPKCFFFANEHLDLVVVSPNFLEPSNAFEALAGSFSAARVSFPCRRTGMSELQAVSGTATVLVAPGKKVDHLGIKAELIGQIGECLGARSGSRESSKPCDLLYTFRFPVLDLSWCRYVSERNVFSIVPGCEFWEVGGSSRSGLLKLPPFRGLRLHAVT